MPTSKKPVIPLRISEDKNINAAISKKYVDRLMINGEYDRYVIANQVTYKSDTPMSKAEVMADIRDECNDIASRVRIDQCCWDKTLYLIHSAEYYKHKKQKEEETNSGANGLNELQYADTSKDSNVQNEGLSGGNQHEGDPDINEGETGGYSTSNQHEGDPDINEGEGNIQFSSVMQCNPGSCEKRKESGACIIKRKVQVGVVDFGFHDLHGKLVNHIILGNGSHEHANDSFIQTHDYNVLPNFGIANSMAICCQIARGIEEGMDILNISMGYYGTEGSKLIEEYLVKASYAGMLVVFSAGNSSVNVKVTQHWSSNFAEDENLPNVLSVGAVHHKTKKLAGYTNFGDKKIVSAYCNGRIVLPANYNHYAPISYERIAYGFGTSFAAPRLVAKIAKLFHLNGKTHYIGNSGFDKDMILNDLNPSMTGGRYTNLGGVIFDQLPIVL